MKERRLLLLASLGFGAVFLWSGVAKVKDPLTFAESIRNFRLVGDPFVAAFAHFLPWLEIFAGVAVMWDRLRLAAAAILTLLLVVFTLAIVLAWARGLEIACGCFGGEEITNYPVKLAQNLGLIAWGALLWRASAPRRRQDR
jgi:putative oxidoreductase